MSKVHLAHVPVWSTLISTCSDCILSVFQPFNGEKISTWLERQKIKNLHEKNSSVIKMKGFFVNRRRFKVFSHLVRDWRRWWKQIQGGKIYTSSRMTWQWPSVLFWPLYCCSTNGGNHTHKHTYHGQYYSIFSESSFLSLWYPVSTRVCMCEVMCVCSCQVVGLIT